MSQDPIFVDSSGWVALIDRADQQHPPARAYWRTAQTDNHRFVTTDYVLDETYTLLRRRRRGLEMAVVVHDLVLSSQVIEVVKVEQAVLDAGWSVFVQHDDKVLSFTDCTSFALMRSRRLLEAFTFDADFTRAGFLALPR